MKMTGKLGQDSGMMSTVHKETPQVLEPKMLYFVFNLIIFAKVVLAKKNKAIMEWTIRHKQLKRIALLNQTLQTITQPLKC